MEITKADVTRENEIKAMFKKIKKLDVLINNAGTDIPAPLEKYNSDDWKKIIDVNLIGKFLCT